MYVFEAFLRRLCAAEKLPDRPHTSGYTELTETESHAWKSLTPRVRPLRLTWKTDNCWKLPNISTLIIEYLLFFLQWMILVKPASSVARSSWSFNWLFLMLLDKSYGVPINLTCNERETSKIDVSGISLFKSKRAIIANQVYPGIYAQSQSECQRTFHPVNMNKPAGCQLNLSGRKLSSDVMIVTVYRCFTTSDLQRRLKLVHISKCRGVPRVQSN